MYDELVRAIIVEKEKLEAQKLWIIKFLNQLHNFRNLENTWYDKNLVVSLHDKVSRSLKIAAVDGGVVSEAMSGFDLILYRGIATVFTGIGDRVEAQYIPRLDPEPYMFFSASLPSRAEFNRLITLKRLYVEYDVAVNTIQTVNPTCLVLDGKVAPLMADFTQITLPSKILLQAEIDVKQKYRELVDLCISKSCTLIGVVKDSRSRDLTDKLSDLIPQMIRKKLLDSKLLQGWRTNLLGLLDEYFSSFITKKGERTTWVQSPTPNWLPKRYEVQIYSSMLNLVEADYPIRVEILMHPKLEINSVEVCLSALQVLTEHGLPVAIPTVILEADTRVKLSSHHLESIIDQISISLDIPKEQIRKRRLFQGI